ncbi:phosphoenolpyruvate--protein phosphotransferase [Desulfosporosinus sp. BICA1-9]|uniref:phosphoenolpyruvate--protein phosphotransferase n=1 Tax=Desulfosporosinus sp. BICA1-9 TaxID=1531958 RepID=UPI00054C1098|nr:phosphoenolpyruvate--protein phosphotransferase [Desulfosporosinus sp. BICA1-9]KJS50292.1 MAG: phosphoenolpyruvate-protein phosphotransferase [Peptococcaceae bacterium BRH_c23]KJS85082.1 MAG: phosphoenolpyruvate-protein phosphotransferase [Desulfosporosinus sp. BICA1-9]HBW34102.1 phosphoenolpyruvate--protein phosphotransferase [Desulfosporosinus sp.]
MDMDKNSWLGLGVSAGRAAGKVWLLQTFTSELEYKQEGEIDAEQELARSQKAVELTNHRLTQYEQQVRTEKGEEFAQIFTAHKLLLTDPAFIGEAQKRIKSRNLLAEQALKEVAAEAVQMLQNIPDPYFQERAVDVQDVLEQLLQNLLGAQGSGATSFPKTGDWIVVAEELTPAQTIALPKDRVLGFIVRKGGKTSHAAILARTYGIPAVSGVDASWEELTDLTWAELDGDEGSVKRSPEGITFIKGNDSDEEEQECLTGIFGNMVLAANVGSPEDLPLVQKFKAQGVGLYRTEFLFMGDQLPSEEEQVEAYSKVIAACAPHLTVIRTLDIGGDKRAPALELPKEQNPFLGVRALRLCLRRPEVFKVQLRAIWRASAAGPSAVMFPMIATLEELLQAKELLQIARDEVVREGWAIGKLEVGMMIEIPAAAWNSKRLAAEVDFFSIGTNDLTQYMLAVDRENNELADLYQPHHPAVLGMIARVSQAAEKAGIWVGICGEAGGDSILAPFFAALGIKELSMAPGSLPKVRQTLSKLTFKGVDKQTLVDSVLDCATAAEVMEQLNIFSA